MLEFNGTNPSAFEALRLRARRSVAANDAGRSRPSSSPVVGFHFTRSHIAPAHSEPAPGIGRTSGERCPN